MIPTFNKRHNSLYNSRQYHFSNALAPVLTNHEQSWIFFLYDRHILFISNAFN